MRAAARLVATVDSRGVSRAAVQRSESPLLIRCRPGVEGRLDAFLVGGAAGPLGGDELLLDIEVGERAAVCVRSVAASLAQPGATGGRSSTTVTARLGDGAALDWWPEPLISVAGSEHEVATTIECAPGARLRWVDEVALGRAAQASGHLTVRQRVTVDGRPILHHEVIFDPHQSPLGRHGPMRFAVTAIEVGLGARPATAIVEPDVRAARFTLADGATAWTVLAADLPRARATLEALGLPSRIAS